MTIKKVSKDVKNSDICYCIDEYVRPIENREILKEHWFGKKTFEQIAAKHNISVETVKSIMYTDGSVALEKATEI